MTQQNPTFRPPWVPTKANIAERLRESTVGHHRAQAAAQVAAEEPAPVDSAPSGASVEEDAGPKMKVEDVAPDHRITYGEITIAQCEIDQRIQRPLVPKHVAEIARNWNISAAGTVVISVRIDPETGEERYILLDGQQRFNGALKAGYKGSLRAEFHYDLTLAQEAQLFRLYNNKRAVGTTVKFNASVFEGDTSTEGVLANAIERILRELNIERTPRGFNAVNLAMRIARHNNGLLAFRWALEVIQETWKIKPGHDTDYKSEIVEALALLYLAHGTLIDRDRMVRLLREGTKDEGTLIGSGKSRRQIHKGTLVPNIINEINFIYNRQLRESGGRRLPEWDVKRRGL